MLAERVTDAGSRWVESPRAESESKSQSWGMRFFADPVAGRVELELPRYASSARLHQGDPVLLGDWRREEPDVVTRRTATAREWSVDHTAAAQDSNSRAEQSSPVQTPRLDKENSQAWVGKGAPPRDIHQPIKLTANSLQFSPGTAHAARAMLTTARFQTRVHHALAHPGRPSAASNPHPAPPQGFA